MLQEILYRYSALGRRDLARDAYDLFVEIYPVVLSVTLADTDRARDLLSGPGGISVRDAVHAAVMLNHEVEWIARFDTGSDPVPGLPAESGLKESHRTPRLMRCLMHSLPRATDVAWLSEEALPLTRRRIMPG